MAISIRVIKYSEKEKKYKEFFINVDESNQVIVRKSLELEYNKIVEKLKIFEASGMISSIKRPSNKSMQKLLDSLVHKKQIIGKSIETIKQFFK